MRYRYDEWVKRNFIVALVSPDNKQSKEVSQKVKFVSSLYIFFKVILMIFLSFNCNDILDYELYLSLLINKQDKSIINNIEFLHEVLCS